MTTAPLSLSRRPKRRARGRLGTAFLLTPGGLLLALFAVLPLAAIVVIGFTTDAGSFTTANFAQMLGSPVYMSLLGRTLLIAFGVTVVSIALAWPAAWALARYTSPRVKPLILGFVIIPYITSQLLLIYGFVSLIQAGGPVMSLLSAIGMADPQASIMYTPAANILMLVQESIPTAILVMYSASEQISGSVLEASRTLGASKGFVFTRVIWPLSTAMIGVNFALTFVQTVGAFAEPTILGGPNGQMLGNALATQLQSGVHQQFAVAMSLVLLVTSLAIVGAVTGLLAWSRSALSGVAKPRTRKAVASPPQPRAVDEALATEGVLR
ncbi:ABC transporter permease [Leifsonia shinshuensis]|uniref:ABC-type spermidine/putrescine transport system permease subunit I n=2 Tax=Leifsonia shinshuensis TaxID=150026 RepID=A0A853CZW3_9MICO|nr:ABC transporter permease [Leifsonia shinshuensis]NYJ25719.1 ABC-type spermidine/putrescine transport system permease subunit I [Leifsonia shinshuensis]